MPRRRKARENALRLCRRGRFSTWRRVSRPFRASVPSFPILHTGGRCHAFSQQTLSSQRLHSTIVDGQKTARHGGYAIVRSADRIGGRHLAWIRPITLPLIKSAYCVQMRPTSRFCPADETFPRAQRCAVFGGDARAAFARPASVHLHRSEGAGGRVRTVYAP